jgi:hypothetical protein
MIEALTSMLRNGPPVRASIMTSQANVLDLLLRSE